MQQDDDTQEELSLQEIEKIPTNLLNQLKEQFNTEDKSKKLEVISFLSETVFPKIKDDYLQRKTDR